MRSLDPHPHSHSLDRLIPTLLERPSNLPADVIHMREVEWLAHLKHRLAAVQAWRGQQPGSQSTTR